MLREKMQKIKMATFILFVMSIMMMSLIEVKAEDPPTVTIGVIEYTINVENRTAQVADYVDWSNPKTTEVVIASKILYEEMEYTVTSIEEGAFSGSSYIEKVEIPATVTEIESYAFAGCGALKEVNLPEGIKKIEMATFIQCESLESIEIPVSVEIIDEAAFLGCKKLKRIVIPNGVTELATCCFSDCDGLEEVVIPNSVKTIEDAVFLGNLSLTQVLIPENVESVPSSILLGCENLKTVIYPVGVKESFLIEDYADQLQLSYVINPDGTLSLTVENLPEGMTDIDLPSDIGGRKISSITGPEGMEIAITCKEHFVKEYSKDASEHWYVCSVCKKEIREAHVHKSDAATGTQPCVCGYVPFAITAQPASQQLPYAYTNSSLAVTVKATFGKEKITYQWMEDGKAIAGATASTYAIPTGKMVGSYAYTCKVICGGYSKVTTAATVTVQAPSKGKKYKDDTNMATYKVTKAAVNGSGKVEYVKPVNKKKKVVTIPATVKIGGVTYKVTSIAKNAFKNNRYIKRVTIEKNVEKIGARAFYNCKKLKNIVIKTKKLKAKKIGADAFKNIKSNATIKAPKKKVKAYKTILKKKGVGASAKIRKM